MRSIESSLPYFDPSRPLVISRGDLKDIAQSDTNNETFLRYVYTTGPSNESLDERIERTKQEFDRLGALCGAEIVKHTFGLYPIEDPKYVSLSQPFIVPEDSLLCAEVAIIRNQPLYKPRPLAIHAGIKRYHDQAGTLCDIRAGQFRWGRPSSDEDGQNRWIMVDIEPRHTHPGIKRYTRL